MEKIKVGLIGQPNCGKSTVFNMLSGFKQHVANYPGVTVDKKVGEFKYKDKIIELVDLPGTYSFSSFTDEEKVAKSFILDEDPDILINVIDSTNIKRNLYLTFQLLEIGKPMILVFNMSDIAKGRGIEIDKEKISKLLASKVIFASANKNQGKTEILDGILDLAENTNAYEEFKIIYEDLENQIFTVGNAIVENEELSHISKRWLAIKVLENDRVICDKLEKLNPDLQNIADSQREIFKNMTNKTIDGFLAKNRYENADIVFSKSVNESKKDKETLTDKIDKFVLNRWLSFPFLLLIIFLIYELAIVFGEEAIDLTGEFILEPFKDFINLLVPSPDISQVAMITNFANWIVNSINALLEYVPVFFILFALIAILEDTGYMPRIAFILDKVFRKFGLHGQSTLPLALGGAFVGGCAAPGVMATKGMADDRARMATILTVPLMNCQAKIPLYALLVGTYFAKNMGIMMFYISTVTIFTALIVAKILTSTILKTRATAPFVMELPPYHLPTFKGVMLRTIERVWDYIKKVCTIVVAVSVILFVLMEFPGLSQEKLEAYNAREKAALTTFKEEIQGNSYYELVNSREKLARILNEYGAYLSSLKGEIDDYGKVNPLSQEEIDEINEKFAKNEPELFKLFHPDGENKEILAWNAALKNLLDERDDIISERQNEKLENSILGKAGKALEPLTKYAGFDWKVNIAFLSSFAAKESTVATLGSLYEDGMQVAPNPQNNDKSIELEDALSHQGYTSLMAAAMILFMILTPPCITTSIVIKMQTNSYKWMTFSIIFPFAMGLIITMLFYSLGNKFSLSGVETMSYYYFITVALAVILYFLPSKAKNWSGGMKKNF